VQLALRAAFVFPISRPTDREALHGKMKGENDQSRTLLADWGIPRKHDEQTLQMLFGITHTLLPKLSVVPSLRDFLAMRLPLGPRSSHEKKTRRWSPGVHHAKKRGFSRSTATRPSPVLSPRESKIPFASTLRSVHSALCGTSRAHHTPTFPNNNA